MKKLIEQRDKNALQEGLINFYAYRLLKITKKQAKMIYDRLNINENIAEKKILELSNEELNFLYRILRDTSLHI